MSTQQVSAAPALAEQLRDPAYSAYLALRTVFTIAPIVFGLDKFFNLLTHPHHWSMYLAGWIDDLVPGTADQCMYLVGIVEIVAGVVVAVARGWVPGWSRPGWPGSSSTWSPGPASTTSRCATGLFVGAVALARLAQGVHSGRIAAC